MRITSSGNVGIGTTAPATLLEVSSAGVTQIRAVTTDATGGSIAGLLLDQQGTGASSFIVRAGGSYTVLGSTTNTPVLFFANNTERARLDSSGRLLVGTSTASAFAVTTTTNLQVQDTGTSLGIGIEKASADTAGANLCFRKTRSTTPGGVASVVDGDILGHIRFSATDGTSLLEAANIRCVEDGTPSTGNIYGRLMFYTSDGGSRSTERLRIDNAGTATHTSNASTAPFIAKISTSEVARIDSSGRWLVGTSSAVAGSAQTASIIGSSLIQSTGLQSLAASATLDLNLLGTGIVGHLYVTSTLTSNALARTMTTYFITTRQGDGTVITSLNTANGSSGGKAFTITNPSTNVFRFTDTSATACTVSMSFVGTMSL
jgi:hypothetical protein